MLSRIKKLLPQPIKEWLRPLKNKWIDNPRKRKLFLHMQKKHQVLLQQIKGKEKIKVVFLAIHTSVWKVDPVFQKMLGDPFFEPVILVCPYTPYGEERMRQDMQECYEYFQEKGYSVLSSYHQEENRWITLKEIQPDIVFFTNPHNLTRKEYYEDAYLNYLSCYVPYHHEVGSYGDDIAQYNQDFHNSVWKIFASHNSSYEIFKKVAQTKAMNVVVSGYPAMETLIELRVSKNISDPWINKDSRFRVIWAPHHTIDDPVLPYSNFLKYAEAFKQLADKYKENLVWCFKPHPILKSKLYLHENWGRVKTDEYYDYWKNSAYTQISEGDYAALFIHSNFMIHDSGSFLAEYLYLEKPVMYLLDRNNGGQFYTGFGKKALDACAHGHELSDIVEFIEENIFNNKGLTSKHELFMKEEVTPLFMIAPSEKIIENIVMAIE